MAVTDEIVTPRLDIGLRLALLRSGTVHVSSARIEREIAAPLRALLGEAVRVNADRERHDGPDILGIDGWAPIVRYARTPRLATIRAWWIEATDQAERHQLRPVLFCTGGQPSLPWCATVARKDVTIALRRASKMRTFDFSLNGFAELVRLVANEPRRRVDRRAV